MTKRHARWPATVSVGAVLLGVPWAAAADESPTTPPAETSTSATSSGATDGSEPSATPSVAVDVPNLGQAWQSFRSEGSQTSESSDPVAVTTVHGVRRVDGGTVLYYSVGIPKGAAETSGYSLTYRAYGLFGDGVTIADNGLVDAKGRKAYSGLVAGGSCLCSKEWSRISSTPGSVSVLYQVMPELPADVTTVDVYVNHRFVPNVPVEDGALTPEVDGTEPVAVGTGWPKVDLSAIGQADPDASVHDLTQRVSDVKQTVQRRETTEKVSVDLAADVLFAVDKANLTSAANEVIDKAVKEMEGATGTVRITGHTDSTGQDAHNLDLSRRRAASVEKALRGRLDGVTFQVEGRGETEPIATNETVEGRRLNRRVSIEYTQGGAQ